MVAGATGQQFPATANITLVASTATPGMNGTFNLNGFNQTIGGLNSTGAGGVVQNNGISGNSTLTINATTAPSSYTGVIQDQDGTTGGTGTLALALSGNQSLALTGASTYTGGTTVSGSSTLFANNTTGSATGIGTVTIGASSTLAGSGIITGPVSFTGGTLAPSSGSTTPATLSLGSTTLDAASHSDFHRGARRHGRRWCERPGRGRRQPGLGR